EEIDRRGSLRMQRQQQLTRPRAPKLWAGVGEAAPCRAPGGPPGMRAPLRAPPQPTGPPHLTLPIVPLPAGPHPAAGRPLTPPRLPEPDLPDVVYLEQLNSAVYLDQPADVIDYVTVMDQLCVQAAMGAASRDMLSEQLQQA